jgi:hypothetical protein
MIDAAGIVSTMIAGGVAFILGWIMGVEERRCWVSVGEGLPGDDVEVWVYDRREVTIGYHNRYGWFDIYGEDDGMRDSKIYGVTHWMLMDRPAFP